ncbi:MAG: PAS domain-containing protein, partial [Woeseiaceae bacterium]
MGQVVDGGDSELMAGHSILYLGRGDFSADYLEKLKASRHCSKLTHSETLAVPNDAPNKIDLILFEAGPGIAQSGQNLQSLIHSLSDYPLVAATTRQQEHRGIAAVRSGAQNFICVDDISEAEQKAVFDHAIQRYHLMTRLSDTDGTVLGILKSINDGVIVVDRDGHVLDINPAARSILGLAPRYRPGDKWSGSFCNVATDGKTLLDREEMPLVKARSGQKFSDQAAIYRTPDQEDTVLSINGQGLYDGSHSLIGGVITFRDVTDIMKRTVELEKRAQYDELTLLPNRRLFIRQLEKAIGRSERTSRSL